MAAATRRRRRPAVEDPDEQAWQAAATGALEAYSERREGYERAWAQASNRTERRRLGRPPELKLPPLPDFRAKAPAEIGGEIFGRFLVHPDEAGTGGTAHDVYGADEACEIERTPRTFVHFAGELEAHYPDADRHAACFERAAEREG